MTTDASNHMRGAVSEIGTRPGHRQPQELARRGRVLPENGEVDLGRARALIQYWRW